MKERSSTLRVKAEGLDPQRFLTDCMKAGIPLRRIRRRSDTELSMELPGIHRKALQRAAGNTWRITVQKETGVVPALKRMIKNPAGILGILLLAGTLWYKTLFVSEIRISGYETLTEEFLRETLAEAGFMEGCKKNADLNKLKLALYQSSDRITWVGIHYKGSLAQVEIAESTSGAAKIGPSGSGSLAEFGTPEPGTPDGSSLGPAHVIAKKDGYISRVLPLEGEETVAAGDFVKKGDLLITGVIPVTDSTYETDRPLERYVRAEGQVYAVIPYRFTGTLPRYAPEPLTEGNHAAKTTYTLRERTPKELESLAEMQIRRFIKENVPETAEIRKKDLNFVQEENIIEVNVLIQAEEEIGLQQSFTPSFPPVEGGEERMN